MHTKQQQSGFVLLVTVIMIAAVTTVILAYSQTVRIFHDTIANTINDNKARNAAHSGLEFALAYLNSTKDIAGYTKLTTDFDDVKCDIIIECENGKLNINNLINASGEYSTPYTELLLGLIDLYNNNPKNNKISYGMVPAIIDAIDPDDKVIELPLIARNNKGAEKNYYRDAGLPLCNNSKLQRIYDLTFIKDCQSSLLENLADDTGREFISCLTTADSKKIDINSAPAEILAALSPDISLSKAKEISTAQSTKGYSSLEEFYTAAAIGSDTTALDGILEIDPQKKVYSITVKAIYAYKTIKLTAISKKDDNDRYNGKKMYCN